MKKFLILCVIMVSAALSSLCSQKEFTVKALALTKDEQRIASFLSDVSYKFLLEKGRQYEINLYLYKDGLLENIGGASGNSSNNNILYISGRRSGNVGYEWNILWYGKAKYPAAEIDDDRTFAALSGSGIGSSVVMEEGKEYVLAYVGYIEGNSIPTSMTEPFFEWSTLTDKAGALGGFAYAYVITIEKEQ